MLSESISRPSLPIYDVLRASQERLSSPEVRGLLRRLDAWAALAVVLVASSAVWQFGMWMIERWQLR
jgi:hypothetical protein